MSENENVVREYNNPGLSETIKKFHQDQESADVHFLFGSDNPFRKRIPAHKILLAAVSDVFKAMFFGSLKEKGDVYVDDVSAAAFEVFLQFFYIGRVKLTTEHIADVMRLGQKYNVINCFESCAQFIMDTLGNENACTGLGLAIFYDHTVLKQFCERHISLNSDIVFKSSDFLECDHQVLKHILKMDRLSCPEIEVFEACMSWVKSTSKQDVLSKEIVQAHLGASFYDIRFASMTVQEFATLPAAYNCLFSIDEYKEIVQTISVPNAQPKRFNNTSRQFAWNENSVITCNRCISEASTTKAFALRTIETTTFSTNQPVLLGSFECATVFIFRGVQLGSNLAVRVRVVEASDLDNAGGQKILCNQNAKILPVTDTKIALNRPVLIKPGLFYKVQVHSFPEKYFSYKRELATEMQIDSDINIKFHSLRKGPDNITVGLINSLIFNRI